MGLSMKFNNIKNIFAPKNTEFDLTEKEIEYILMLSAGVNKNRVMNTLSITYAKIRNLYSKLGLTNTRRKRDVQAATLFAGNNLIKDDMLLNIYKKYNCIECKELAELTTKA